eukprot:2099961-Prymnesium_polylepis.1
MRDATPQLVCMLLPTLDKQIGLQAEAVLTLADCANAAPARSLLRGEQLVEHAVRRLRALTSLP